MLLVRGTRVVAVLCLLGCTGSLVAQDLFREADLTVVEGSPLEKSFQKMMPDYLLGRARQATEKRLARLGSIKSEVEFRNWQQANRQRFLELIGGLPTERTPLKARVVGELVREGYVVRKIIFESLPEFYVTANLYVPTRGKAPYPAVLSPIGHSRNGKAYANYQQLFIGLAKQGYVVLTWDPLGQGERLQYWDVFKQRRSFESNQHTMAGLQEYLLGHNLARYFIWDGIRALDYLTSLPEVDPSRIGCTGNSGGGTLTTYISMLDPRIKVSSIVTFITSLSKKIEARDLDAESDPEQDIEGLLAAGIDHTEMIGMIAPRPVLIGAATRDFFPIEGTRQTFSEVQSLYNMLGVPERVKMVEFDHRHMYSQPLREATTAWFDRWLRGREGEIHEPPIAVESDATLECTPSGQVVTSLGGQRIMDFNRRETDRLVTNLAALRLDRAFYRGLPEKVRARLVLPQTAIAPRARKVGERESSGLHIEKLLIETEPGIEVPTRLISLPRHAGRLPTVVYLRDRLGDQDRASVFESVARQGRLIAVADVRGFGETWSPRTVNEPTARYFDPHNGVDADFTYASFFLDRPLLGMRVWDALNVVHYLLSRPDVDAGRITVVGRGWASVIVLFTAALDPQISAVGLEGTPASYELVARAELYNFPASLLLPGALQDFDLPDLVASLAPRPLILLDPIDPLSRKLPRVEQKTIFQSVFDQYNRAKAINALSIRTVPLEADVPQELTQWILDN